MLSFYVFSYYFYSIILIYIIQILLILKAVRHEQSNSVVYVKQLYLS